MSAAVAAAADAPVVAPNGVHVPPLSTDNGALSSAPDSPMVPSPETTAAASPDVKIDIDDLNRESDVRNEPITLQLDKVDKIDDASTLPQLSTPVDPGLSASTSHIL